MALLASLVYAMHAPVMGVRFCIMLDFEVPFSSTLMSVAIREAIFQVEFLYFGTSKPLRFVHHADTLVSTKRAVCLAVEREHVVVVVLKRIRLNEESVPIVTIFSFGSF